MKGWERQKVRFTSRGESCAAWHYPGTNGACIVMAGGFAVPKEPATDRFAARFAAAGFSVLAFDYRHLGESAGTPRLVLSVSDALSDWRAAIECARELPEVDPRRVAVWAFSASAGHVFPLAATDGMLAAAVAQTPLVDAPAAAPLMARHSTPWAQLRLLSRGLLDTLGGWIGREPLLVPLTGPKGSLAMLSSPDALEGDAALEAARHPDWRREVAARSVMRLGLYRPIRHARRARCPVLVLLCEQDRSVPRAPAERAAGRAPGAELATILGGHYAPFTDSHEQAVDIELSFLERHLLDTGGERGERLPGEPVAREREPGLKVRRDREAGATRR